MAPKFTTLSYLPTTDDVALQSAIAAVKKFEGVTSIYYGQRLEDESIVDLAIGMFHC